jgi:uncharacterized membrane protein YphA (DoxX/SURF4 family)
MLSAAFIGQGIEALLRPKPAADAARPTLEGLRKLPDPVGSNVPHNAEAFARVNAAVQIGGGLLLATGRVPRLASAALAATVVPGSLGAHMFWTETDPERKAQKRREFLTDVSLLGGLIIASADTAGKPSLGWRGRTAARHLGEAVSSALPSDGDSAASSLLDSEIGERLQEGLHVGAERGRELAHVGAERGRELAHVGAERGRELAHVGAERGRELATVGAERGRELASAAVEHGAPLLEAAREQGEQLAETARTRARAWRSR